MPKSEASLETKALNNLKTALLSVKDEFEEFIPFIRILIEDMQVYKTLPKSTLRRFANIKLGSAKPNSLEEFKTELKVVSINLGIDVIISEIPGIPVTFVLTGHCCPRSEESFAREKPLSLR